MNDYEKLKDIYDQIDSLISAQVNYGTPEFQAWLNKAQRFILRKYGDGFEYKKFGEIPFFIKFLAAYATPSARVEECKNGLLIAKGMFKDYLEEMKEELADEEKMKLPEKKDPTEVFIIHGHDEVMKEKTARLLENQGIKAVILSEQVSGGRTIIEQLEKCTNVSAAVCLFTADDSCIGENETKPRKRARQNVVFETGLLMGRIGREKLIIFAEKDVELPSDLKGVIYIDENEWKISLLNGLEEIGFKVDMNKLR